MVQTRHYTTPNANTLNVFERTSTRQFSPVPNLSPCVRGLKLPPRQIRSGQPNCFGLLVNWELVLVLLCLLASSKGDTGRGGTHTHTYRERERERGEAEREEEETPVCKCLAHQPRSEPIIEARYSEPTRCYPIRGPRSPRN